MSANELYRQDLAWIQSVAFAGLARGAAPAIVQRLQAADIVIRQVIDAGCGAGPLTEALTAAGFEVTGIDQSAELLALAQAAVPAARFIHASIYEAQLPDCQAVIALGEPLTYHGDETNADARVQQFFHRVAQLLPSGGMLIFDVIETGETSLNGRFWTSGPDWAVLAETIEDPASRTLLRTIETFRRETHLYRRTREVHKVRLFDSQTIAGWLEQSGFAVETARSYGQQPLGPRRRAFFATLK